VVEAERRFNVVIRDDTGGPLTVWFETDNEMLAFVQIWDAVQRERRSKEAGVKELPEESGAPIVFALLVFYGVILGLALAFVLTLVGWWP
jgi:hypothetical protein